jgi:superfamily II DNA or RNA helicase
MATEPEALGAPADDEVSRLRADLAEAQAEIARLRVMMGEPQPETDRLGSAVGAWSPRLFAPGDGPSPLPSVDAASPAGAKVELYRALFVGRDDVYATRWERADGSKGWGPARALGPGPVKTRPLLPLTDDVIVQHLSGRLTAGLYPLMAGDVCRLLACDLDGRGWQADALAYLEVCSSLGVPAYLERSRSGDGGHLWTFFDALVPAASARALGAALLRETMALRGEIDLASYDRLFPSQDFLPQGRAFGNLIGLPLHGGCRREGNTVFMDPARLEPWPDQWAFLSSVSRLAPEAVEGLRGALRPLVVGPEEARHPRRSRPGDRSEKAPAEVHGVRGAMVGIERAGLPPWLLADLRHLASTHNPEFHRRQQQRRSTYGHSALIRSYEEDLEHIWIPRGLEEAVVAILAEAGTDLELGDALPDPAPAQLDFLGSLSPTQRHAVDAVSAHHRGVLVAPTGAGKTAMACALIAHHCVPTLVVVDRQALADQWRAQLSVFLGLEGRQVGQLGGGRKRRSRIVDIAMFGSLANRVSDPDLFDGYGLVVVDECHHVPAPSYEQALRHAPIRRWLGLTATPRREDGLHPLITMQCGPIRHTMSRSGGPLVLRVITHESLADPGLDERAGYTAFMTGLAADEERNAAIVADVSAALGRGRNCLVLTQRVDHLARLSELVSASGHVPYVLQGGMGKKARTAVADGIAGHLEDSPILILATGPYAGEGFDCPRLDTVFLALPIRSRTKITQYIGRTMRDYEAKASVEVHDYDDKLLPIFRRGRSVRMSVLAGLGFDIRGPSVVET